ncbi:hypothetical protein Q0M94_19190 (plasmid) [Deinococcus radiomollis]|uniref:hypothetical protein n=1 Tax=Deinococcus radiomollis TaxID=468916 RepID=UPI003891A0DB
MNKTKATRTNEEKLAGTKEIALINGNPYSPLRLKVMQVHNLLNQKAEKVKLARAIQLKAVRSQSLIQGGDEAPIYKLPQNDQYEKMIELQELMDEFNHETEFDYSIWLVEKLYPEAVASGDFELIEEDELALAVDAACEVNPSLKDNRAKLLQNPMKPTL